MAKAEKPSKKLRTGWPSELLAEAPERVSRP